MGRKLFTCPCCGYKTLSELNSWEICVVCRWEDDPLQSDEPDFAGGANVESLREAQKNWNEFGVYSKNLLVEKNDRAAWRYEKDSNYKPL